MRAKAGIIRISAVKKDNLLTLSVEDDGPGLPVTHAQALDPFFTTKKSKKTGLGLSLFQASAEQAGGDFSLDKSPLGGLSVTARFQYDHWDRAPLGSFVGTLQTVTMSAPEIVWVCHIEGDEAQHTLILQDFLADAEGSLITALRAYKEALAKALDEAGITS